jgi:hypothetical protein
MSFSGRHNFTRCGKNQFAKRFWEGYEVSRADKCFPFVRPERAQLFKKTRVREGHDVTTAEKLNSQSGFGRGTTSVVPISAFHLCFPSGLKPARNLLPPIVRQRLTDAVESPQNMIYDSAND